MDKYLEKNINALLRRSDIQPNIFYQPDREFSERGGWYFRTRELEEIGPFETREEARESMEMFFLLNADAAPATATLQNKTKRVHH